MDSLKPAADSSCSLSTMVAASSIKALSVISSSSMCRGTRKESAIMQIFATKDLLAKWAREIFTEIGYTTLPSSSQWRIRQHASFSIYRSSRFISPVDSSKGTN